jgi:hypothetical protein
MVASRLALMIGVLFALAMAAGHDTDNPAAKWDLDQALARTLRQEPSMKR